jgi:tRNA(adenine34) deaminase
MEDKFFMERCLQLAADAKRNGKTAVGAVVTKDNQIVAEGIEGDNSLPSLLSHAEVIAIIAAIKNLDTKDLSNCVLYTTVEPCFMCSYVIREARIARVVFGAKAGDIGGMYSSYPLLTATDISKWQTQVQVHGGLLERECLQLLQKAKG